MMKLIDINGVKHLITELDGRYILVEAGKSLMTDAERAKLAALNMPIDGLASTAADAPLSANQGRELKAKIDAINGAGYQTEAEVAAAIAEAVGAITSITYEVVAVLPEAGEAGVIYLVVNSGATGNIYDEYLWLGTAYEKIGTTEMDLSGYLKTEDIVAMTNAEIDAILAGN